MRHRRQRGRREVSQEDLADNLFRGGAARECHARSGRARRGQARRDDGRQRTGAGERGRGSVSAAAAGGGAPTARAARWRCPSISWSREGEPKVADAAAKRSTRRCMPRRAIFCTGGHPLLQIILLYKSSLTYYCRKHIFRTTRLLAQRPPQLVRVGNPSTHRAARVVASSTLRWPSSPRRESRVDGCGWGLRRPNIALNARPRTRSSAPARVGAFNELGSRSRLSPFHPRPSSLRSIPGAPS